MKRCCKCRIEKPLDDFHHQSASRDGHKARCKLCVKEVDSLRPPRPPTQQSREYRRIQGQKWRSAHAEAYRAYQRVYHRKHAQRLRSAAVPMGTAQ